MSAPAPTLVVLQAHPETPATAVESIKASLHWTSGTVLAITYTLSGIVERLRIPPTRSVRRSNDLWCHTCFELFVGAQNDAEYYEFNFSPSGEWAAYGFRDYRDGGPFESEEMELKITVSRDARTVNLNAVVRLDCLPGIQSGVTLGLGLSAVLENADGSLSYWALKHPPGKPDFHHPDSFALQVQVGVGDGAGDTRSP